jgi:mannose-6-phosphate isomerase-like protein (cupin superfamily)
MHCVVLRRALTIMTSKIIVEPLPIIDEPMPIRRLIQPRGELALIEDGREFRHLGYFSIRKGEGYFRGGHYHLEKIEYLYIIEGRVLLSFVDLDSNETSSIELNPGDRVTITPRCAHRFDALEDVRVIEYFNSIHDPRDDYRFEPLLGVSSEKTR